MRQFRVEDFGLDYPEYSRAINDRLGSHLKSFDDEYRKAGGNIGSSTHRSDRETVARGTCKL